MMKTLFNLIVILTGVLRAQESTPSPWTAPAVAATHGGWHLDVNMAGSDDPSYGDYREGYALVLRENWEAAMKVFDSFLKKHPRSPLADDAAYWRAYSLRFINEARARDAYREFLAAHEQSSYYDDAVADLTEVEMDHTMRRHKDAAPRAAEQLDQVERELRRTELRIHSLQQPFPPDPVIAPEFHAGKSAELRTRLVALDAAASRPTDPQAFAAIRTVATNPTEPLELRVGAMHALVRFEHFDPLSTYVHIAKTDSSREVQTQAVGLIVSSSKRGNKDQSVTLLIDLYDSLSTQNDSVVREVFYSIASVGNDRAIDFLTKVARTSPDPDLKVEAVYFLSTIGTKKARSSLYQILQSR